jgi:hypothetical protein
MNREVKIALVAVLGAALGAVSPDVSAQSNVTAASKGNAVTQQAKGTFEVKVTPLPEDEKVKGVPVGRLSIEKTWSGDIVGTSSAEMMTAFGGVKGSAGIVGVELMKVSIKGRSGTFTLLHHATMKNNADYQMLVRIIPDSGTGDLVGLSGVLTIIIEGSKHSYILDYTLP